VDHYNIKTVGPPGQGCIIVIIPGVLTLQD